MNLNWPLLGSLPSTRWDIIKENIKKASRSDSEEKYNILVAKSLYDYSVQCNVTSYDHQIRRWNVGFGQSVVYWWNLYSVISARPYFFFFDPRISKQLTSKGCEFVFSMMNERLRVDDPDFSNAELCVVQFSRIADEERVMKPRIAGDVILYSRDELNAMIDETYKLWIDVLMERRREPRSQAVGETPMGF